jgi:hypothetical protein
VTSHIDNTSTRKGFPFFDRLIITVRTCVIESINLRSATSHLTYRYIVSSPLNVPRTMKSLSIYYATVSTFLLFIRALQVCASTAPSDRFPFPSPSRSRSRSRSSSRSITAARKFAPGLVSSLRKTLDVSVATVKTRKLELQLPKLELPKLDLPSFSSTGFYYGITPDSLSANKRERDATPKKKRVDLQETATETLDELRSMRREMEALRREMQAMKRQMVGSEGDGFDGDLQQLESEKDSQDRASLSIIARHARQRHFEKISADVERWAEELLFEEAGEEDGWAEVQPNKVLGSVFNRGGRTKTYMKWMKDSRRKHADPNDSREYPCLKMYSTIDAPLEDVCLYLSQKDNMEEYNDLMLHQGDLEEITPHSKITWCQSYQILFLKPRVFTSFCSHRWLRDGTQVVINQACDHPDTPGKGVLPQGFALRSANFLSRDPDDPEKTRCAMVSHGNPGHDVPKWACKTIVNTMAPIEPFKLFHKVNQNVQRCRADLERRLEETEMVSAPNGPGGTSRRPAGLAQLGYACFWPQGGGVQEGGEDRLHRQQHSHSHNLSHSHGLSDGPTDTVRGDYLAAEEGMNMDTHDAPVGDREYRPTESAVPSP